MSATILLKRKRIFHNILINIAKDHHADFLSKLNPPLQVPLFKLNRWHPRFGLDSVPDINAAELPAPPEKVIQNAKQVLESVRGKLPSRVEQAMVKVAMKSEGSHSAKETRGQQQSSTATSAGMQLSSSAYRGIPQSLLDKIRAKEAAKAQAALMRDPKEEKKTDMIGRLPNLIRSLRAFYVTEKKPSLPFEKVVQKLTDSYTTSISAVDVEKHLMLLQELAPKFLQLVHIARGKYIKVDKNVDITALISRLTDLVKSHR